MMTQNNLQKKMHLTYCQNLAINKRFTDQQTISDFSKSLIKLETIDPKSANERKKLMLELNDLNKKYNLRIPLTTKTKAKKLNIDEEDEDD